MTKWGETPRWRMCSRRIRTQAEWNVAMSGGGGPAGGGGSLLLRRLVRKRDGDDVLRMNALDREEVRDPVGDNPRLPAPRAGQDEQRPFGVGHRLPLGRGEIGGNGVDGQTGRQHGTLP